jgi:hypothetical protein
MLAAHVRGRTVLLGTALVALLAPSVPAPLRGQVPQLERHYALPMSLVEEHAETYGALQRAAALPGELGIAARALAGVLGPHVAKEQRFALSMLKLLRPMSRGEITADMAEWLPAADSLSAELAILEREHRAIAAHAELVVRAAWADGRPEFAVAAQRLIRHARLEEEVLYPAAMVAADYLRLRLAARPAAARPQGKAGTR